MNRMRGDGGPPSKRGRFDGESFNSSWNIQKELNSRKNLPPSKVVAAQILNARYPITLDTIHKVFGRCGSLCRVVVFNRLSINVFVEYPDISSAEKAVDLLHGEEIFPGSCTIKIEFSKKQELQVNRNCDTEWDFTKQPWNESPAFQPGETHEKNYPINVYGGNRNEAEQVKRDWSSWENQTANQSMSFNPQSQRRILNTEPPFHLLDRQKAMSPEQVDRAFYRDDGNPSSKILLYSIMNAIFPITTQLIYKISAPFGTVLKIVIFERFSIQVMVEFENVEDATLAKSKLHNCDIYPNCCSVKVEYAKKENIGVTRNDNQTWSSELAQAQSTKFQGDVRRPGYDDLGPSPPNERPPMFGFSNLGMDPYNPEPRYGMGPMARGDHGDGWSGHGGRGDHGDGWSGHGGLVSMVYNLNPDMFNCERLFNLLCPFGNVRRILFLKQKNFKTAIVEWADPDCVGRVIDCLSYTHVFGQTIEIVPSKKQNVAAGSNDPLLQDGTCAFQDFSRRSNQNRFNSWSKYDNIFPPARTLHFFNTPHMEDDAFENMFRDVEAPVPTKIMWFPVKDGKMRTDNVRSGCLQFDNVTDAAEALVLVNHTIARKTDKDGKKDVKVCLAFTKEREDNDFT